MPRSRFALGFERVNLLKKVKVDGEWRFCPAIVDLGRRLSNKVRINGEIETHNEGTYYSITWNGANRDVAGASRVYGRARARTGANKALELEALRNPPGITSLPESPLPSPVNPASPVPTVVAQPLVAHRFPQ